MISERSRTLLKALIERYIVEGHPVGSKTLSTDAAIALSPATIRNILADLEDKGYLASPHTSSGRIPTYRGLKFFIDSLLTTSPLNPEEEKGLREHLNPSGSREALIEAASSMLSDFTQLVGIVSLPRRDQQLLRHIEFLPLSGQRVLVILVLNEEEVQNRIIKTERSYSASELEQAANYINTVCFGKELLDIRKQMLDLLRFERENLDQMMRTAIEVADRVFQGCVAKNDYVLAGENKLISMVEPFNSQQLRKLFDAFSEKQGVLHLIDECIKASGVQIFIGEEVSERGFEGCSVVTSPYHIDGQVVGALGVIGPTRMPYQRVIPIVDVTSRILSSALNQTF